MSGAVQELSAMIPKLGRSDRQALRRLLDEADYKTWRADTEKFRCLMRGKSHDKRPASEVVSSMRR